MNLDNLIRNWKSSSAGIGAVIMVFVQIWVWAETEGWPQAILHASREPLMWAILFGGGVGLVSKDSTVTGTAAKPIDCPPEPK